MQRENILEHVLNNWPIRAVNVIRDLKIKSPPGAYYHLNALVRDSLLVLGSDKKYRPIQASNSCEALIEKYEYMCKELTKLIIFNPQTTEEHLTNASAVISRDAVAKCIKIARETFADPKKNQ